MNQENRLFVYLSKLILDYLISSEIKNGSRYQIKFVRESNVFNLYDYLKIYAQKVCSESITISTFKMNNYETYSLCFNGVKLIVASNNNNIKEDFLTGLRNNFNKVVGYESNSAILFVHNTNLDSIIKGADSLTKKNMPLHIDSVRTNILASFINNVDGNYSKSEKNLISKLLEFDENDYQIETTSLFDFKKYLEILTKGEIEKADYIKLGIFYDDKIANNEIDSRELNRRFKKNIKWYTEINRSEQLGVLNDYLKKKFDQNGQRELNKIENWSKVSLDDLFKWEENRGLIKFNEYIPNEDELNRENDTLWDKADGHSPSDKKNRNILIFNPELKTKISLSLQFTRKPKSDCIQSVNNSDYSICEFSKSIDLEINVLNKKEFSFSNLVYKEVKNGKKNYLNFKILVVPFSDDIFRGIKSIYKLHSRKGSKFGIEFHSDSKILFNEHFRGNEIVENFNSNNRYEIYEDKCIVLKLDKLNITDKNKFPFTLAFQNTSIYAEIVINGSKPVRLSGYDVWLKKNQSKHSIWFAKNRDEKNNKITITLEHGNQIFFPVSELRENLLLEEQIIDNSFLSCEQNDFNALENLNVTLCSDLTSAYIEIIDFFKRRNKGHHKILPSTVFIDTELEKLYRNYISIFIEQLNKVNNHDALTTNENDLLSLGCVYEVNNYRRLKLSPLHPLLLAYQLLLKEKINYKYLPKDIISKLTPKNLLPFINKGPGEKDYYTAINQVDSLEWLNYTHAKTEGQTISRKNLSKIMSDKMCEFIKHFSHLFNDPSSPILIHFIHLGDCREALHGIFAYLVSAVKSKVANNENPEDVFPVDINIYGSENFTTMFEQFSEFEDPDEIREIFDIDLSVAKKIIEPIDLLNLYHRKIRFYKKAIPFSGSSHFEYSHISFYQFEEQFIEKSENDTRDIASGVSLEGVFSDLPSVYSQGNFRTGYGVKYQQSGSSNDVLEISGKINSLHHISGTSNIYKEHYAFSSVINKSVNKRLSNIYDNSQWVVFINPMVDLSFFKSDKDVVIIHYTDHYANSGGYDSITVTNKWKQYSFILEDYLKPQIENCEDHIIPIINMFNAINGYWLLKLGSQNSKETLDKEKISILSAVKEMLSILHHPNITWVPLSLEEILRVTGAAGLKQSEGLLSVKNLGKPGVFSDDLLMVGLEEIDGTLNLYYYPVEVKIGKNATVVLSKGVIQSNNTYELLYDTLNQEGFLGQLYRNYFSKLILTAASKLSMYDVWLDYSNRWDSIENFRGKLLNDDFDLTHNLRDHIGDYAVLSFKQNENLSPRTIVLNDNVMMVNLFESDGLNDLVQSVDNLVMRYTDDAARGISKNNLLSSKYVSSSEKDINIVSTNNHGQDENTDALLRTPSPHKSIIDDKVEIKQNGITPLSIVFGNKISNNEKIEWFPTDTSKVMHTNTGIIGTMGTGKTQFTKSLITQFHQKEVNNVDEKPIGILIFDYKGDYIKDDFIEVSRARVYNLHKLPYNPLALSIDNNPKPLLPLHTASTFRDTILKAFNLGNRQKAFLRDLIIESYENAGIYKNKPDTWTKAAPTIADVVKLYESKENSGGDSVYTALSELNEYEIFEPDGHKAIPLYDLLDGVTVINLSGYSPEIQNLVVAITLDLFYSQMQNYGHSKIDGNYRQLNKMILVDEADNFLSKNFESLRKILKEGREYGVGTILSTQFLNHFSTGDNEYSNYILTWIIHRVSEIKDKEVGSLFDIQSKHEREELIGAIKSLEKHYSIINLAGSHPVKIKDKAFWELIKEQSEVV